MSDLPAPREGFAGFLLTGKDSALWMHFQRQLVAKVMELVEQIGEEDPFSLLVREQAKEFGGLVLDNLKARLRKEGADVAKVEAEVAKLFSERERTYMEARKLKAEARAIEIDNTIKSLRLALSMTKAMMVGSTDEPTVLFGQNIEAMLEALKDVAGSEGAAGKG